MLSSGQTVIGNLLFPLGKKITTGYAGVPAPAVFNRCQGFSLLELVVVIGIISVLLGVGIRKFDGIQANAERTALENVLGALKSATGIKVASYLAKGDSAGLRSLAGSNPMDRLAEKPKNYLGAFAGIDPATVEGGKWYFDTARQVLVYRVKFHDRFQSSLGEPARAQFAVKLMYTDTNRNGRLDGNEEMEGVQVAALEPYTWTD